MSLFSSISSATSQRVGAVEGSMEPVDLPGVTVFCDYQ